MTLTSTTTTFASSGLGTQADPESGTASTRRTLLDQIITLTAGTPRGQHLRVLFTELDEIDADREFAHCFVEPGTWLSELRAEERDTWDRIADELSA